MTKVFVRVQNPKRDHAQKQLEQSLPVEFKQLPFVPIHLRSFWLRLNNGGAAFFARALASKALHTVCHHMNVLYIISWSRDLVKVVTLYNSNQNAYRSVRSLNPIYASILT